MAATMDMGGQTSIIQILDLHVFFHPNSLLTCRLNLLSIGVTGSAETRKNNNIVVRMVSNCILFIVNTGPQGVNK